MELDEQLYDIVNYSRIISDIHNILEEKFYNNQYGSLKEHDPFKKWEEKVYDKSKQHILEVTAINPL